MEPRCLTKDFDLLSLVLQFPQTQANTELNLLYTTTGVNTANMTAHYNGALPALPLDVWLLICEHGLKDLESFWLTARSVSRTLRFCTDKAAASWLLPRLQIESGIVWVPEGMSLFDVDDEILSLDCTSDTGEYAAYGSARVFNEARLHQSTRWERAAVTKSSFGSEQDLCLTVRSERNLMVEGLPRFWGRFAPGAVEFEWKAMLQAYCVGRQRRERENFRLLTRMTQKKLCSQEENKAAPEAGGEE